MGTCYKEKEQSKVEIDILFVNTAGAGDIPVPKVFASMIQEAVKNQLPLNLEVAVQDPS